MSAIFGIELMEPEERAETIRMINPYNFVNIKPPIVRDRKFNKKGGRSYDKIETAPKAKYIPTIIRKATSSRPEINYLLFSDMDIFGLVYTT